MNEDRVVVDIADDQSLLEAEAPLAASDAASERFITSTRIATAKIKRTRQENCVASDAGKAFEY